MSSMSSDAPIVDGDQTPNTALQLSSRAAGLALFECWLARPAVERETVGWTGT